MVGVLKVVLALQNHLSLRTLHVTEPTPAVDWGKAKMTLMRRNQEWKLCSTLAPDRPRRAEISAFEIEITNAHVIIEETDPSPPEVQKDVSLLPCAPLFLVSAVTEEALHQQLEKLREHVDSNVNQDQLGDLAYS